MRRLGAFAVVVGLALLVPRAVGAQAGYQLQRIVRSGDTVDGSSLLKLAGITGLNDSGQILFTSELANGRNLLALADAHSVIPIYQWSHVVQFDWLRGVNVSVSRPVFAFGPCEKGQAFVWDSAERDTLIQYSGGLTRIVAPSAAPRGLPWFVNVFVSPLVNQHADAVLQSVNVSSSPGSLELFRWNFDSQQLVPLNLKGKVAAGGGVLDRAFATGFNSRQELLLSATLREMGGPTRQGILLLLPNHELTLVALAGQVGVGGQTLGSVLEGRGLSEEGRILFRSANAVTDPYTLYLWDRGALARIAQEGQASPGGGTIGQMGSAWIHDGTGAVLFRAQLDGVGADSILPNAVFLFADGRIIPVAQPGQEMPGGGTLLGRNPSFTDTQWVSAPNSRGQHLFVAELEGGAHGVYLIGPDGTLVLVLKEGATTPFGTVGRIGTAAGFNNRGQIALATQIDQQSTLLLLTPAAP